jgi:hypothetical protein
MMRNCLVLAALVALTVEPAFAVAQTPSISGNAWVAMALLIGFIALIVMVVYGSIHIEKRDARLGRRGDRGYVLPYDDDDIHHHGNF